MKQSAVLFALIAISFASASRSASPLKSVYEWKYIDYLWESEQQKHEYVENGLYDFKTLVPIDVDKSKDGRVFVTVISTKGIAPATLTTVSQKEGDSGHLLAPYPDWSWYVKGDCQRITAVHRIAIDDCNRLWVLDSGVVDGVPVCPAQLLTFDLHTNEMVGKLIIPKEVAFSKETKKGLLVTPIVEDNAPRCDKTSVYMADEDGNGLVVWNTVRLFRLESPTFKPEAENEKITVDGSTIYAKKGISGMALSKRIFPSTARFLTFGPLASKSLYWSATRVIKRSIFGEKIKFYEGRDVLQSQSPAMAFTSEGTLFYGSTEDVSIGCWNRYNKLMPKYFLTVATDKERLQYPSGMKVISKVTENTEAPRSRQSKLHEELWVLTNRMPKVVNGLCDYDEINFRVLVSPVDDLIRGTKCEMPDAARQMLEEVLEQDENAANVHQEQTIWHY